MLLSGTRAEISLQPVLKTMVMQVISLKHMEDHAGAYTHAAAHGRPHAGAGGCVRKEAAVHGDFTSEQAPGRNCCLWRGAHAGTGFLARPVTPWGTHSGTVCFWRTMPSGNTGAVHGGLCLMERTPWWGREGVWGGRRQRDEVLWTKLNLHSLCTAWRGADRRLRSEIKPVKKKVGGSCLQHCLFLFLIIQVCY